MLSRENRTDCLHDQVLFLCWRKLQLSQSVCTVQLLQYIFLHKTVTLLVVIIYFNFVAINFLWYSSCWLSRRRTQRRVDVSVVSSDRVSSVVHYPQVSRVIVVSISSSHHSVVISLLVAELTIVPSEQWNIFKITLILFLLPVASVVTKSVWLWTLLTMDLELHLLRLFILNRSHVLIFVETLQTMTMETVLRVARSLVTLFLLIITDAARLQLSCSLLSEHLLFSNLRLMHWNWENVCGWCVKIFL